MEEQEDGLTPIPSNFHSFSSNGPFTRCLDCDKELVESGSQYVIERAIKNYQNFEAQDVVFEYAICMNCAMKMRAELSKESLAKVEDFFQTNIVGALQSLHNSPESEWLQTCIVTGKPLKECAEYQIYAYCTGSFLFPQFTPYAISGEVLDQISGLLSDKTIDELDRFIDENMGIPPELKELFKEKKPMLI